MAQGDDGFSPSSMPVDGQRSTGQRAKSPGVLILEVMRDGRHIRVRLGKAEPKRETVSSYERIPWNGEVIRKSCLQVLQSLRRAASVSASSSLEQVRCGGQTLYDVLLSPEIKERLRATACEFLILRIDDSLVAIPWELLFDGREFLGNRFSTGRMVATAEKTRPPVPIPGLVPRFSVVSGSSEGLPWAKREVHELITRFRSAGCFVAAMRSNASVQYVRQALRKSDILHYCGHADYRAEEPGGGWILADGQLTAEEVRQMAEGRGLRPLLVFANACQTGRSEDWSEKEENHVYDFARAFLLSGVSLFIGTLWDILDSASAEFSVRFYQALVSGKAVGAAVRSARRTLIRSRGEECLIWASYVLYGDPTASVLRPDIQGDKPGEAGGNSGEEKLSGEFSDAGVSDAVSGIRGADTPAEETASAEAVRTGPPARGPVSARPWTLKITLTVSLTLIVIGLLIGRLWNRGAATRCPPPEDSSNIIGMLHYLNCNQMLYPERPSADPWTSGLLTIALLPIIDYDDAGASGRLDSQRVSSVLYRAFEDAPGIQPVERERLAEILTDLGIGSGRIADPLVAMRVGETVAARMLLVGDLLRGGEFLHLHVRVLECPSSKIVCATNAEGKRDAEGLAKEVPSWMLSRIREFYPLRGRIIETDPEKGQAYLNLGKVDGVRENQRFRVLEDRGPKADREGQMRDEIAELEILRVGERVSHARLATPGVRLEKGMKVELGKIQQN